MEETLRIERMGNGAEAVGRLASGKTVFVAGGAPGDAVRVEVVEEKASFARARIVAVEEPSPLRAEPRCPTGTPAGRLPRGGACPARPSWRRSAPTVGALRGPQARLGAVRAEDLVRLPAGASGSRATHELGLRAGSRARGARRVPAGLPSRGHARDSHAAGVCPLAHDAVAKALKALRGALRFAQGSADLGIFRVGVRHSVRTRETEIALWTKPGAFPRAHVAKTLKSALKATSIVRVLADPGRARKIKGVETLDGKGCWGEELADARFLTSAPSFFQVNTAQAEKLAAEVVEGLGGRMGEEGPEGLDGLLVADLYAGGGTFSVPLARAGADVIAIEAAGSSVRDLRRNAEMSGVDIEVVGGDAARELPELGGLDALVVDPPRAGLADGVAESIAEAAPARVAYVSCNPATWARDVARFEQNGYRLARAQPVDLFPQTHHVEVASLFERE